MVCYERLRRCFLRPNKTFIWSWPWWANMWFVMNAYVVALPGPNKTFIWSWPSWANMWFVMNAYVVALPRPNKTFIRSWPSWANMWFVMNVYVVALPRPNKTFIWSWPSWANMWFVMSAYSNKDTFGGRKPVEICVFLNGRFKIAYNSLGNRTRISRKLKNIRFLRVYW